MFTIFKNARKIGIKIKKNISDQIHLQGAIYIGLLVLIYLYRMGDLFNPMVSDEIGYWASAAWINGINWNGIMSHSAYMGWGYGIFLVPLFVLGNSKYMYYGAVIINVFFMLGTYYNLIHICQELYPEKNKKIIFFVSFVICLYSYNIVFVHMSMCEIALTFFCSSLFLMIKKFIREPSFKKVILICIIQGLLVAIHLRELVLLIATVLFFILYSLASKDKKKMCYVLVYFCISALLVFFVFKIKGALIEEIYTPHNISSDAFGEITNYNNYNDNFMTYINRLIYYMQPSSIVYLFKSIIAKLLYLLESSFFVMGFAGYEIVIKAIKYIKDNQLYKGVFYYYLIIVFIGNLLLLSITMGASGRLDCVMYGRYIENILPVYLAIGFIYILDNKDKWLRIGLKIVVCDILFCICTYSYIEENNINTDLKSILHYQISGISGFPNVKVIRSDIYYTWYVLLIVCLLLVFFYAIGKKSIYCSILLIGICWVSNSYSVLDNFIYNHPETINIEEQTRIKRFEDIFETANDIEEVGGNQIFYVYQEETYIDSSYDVGTLQFDLFDKPINYIDNQNFCDVTQEDILVVHRRNSDYAEYKSEFSLIKERYYFGIFRVK